MTSALDPHLSLGCISYINVLPVTHGLPEAFGARFDGSWEMVYGSPEKLNDLLARGRLDVSPVSSIEYARHQAEYALLPDLAIASRGAVASVMLFTRTPLEKLDGAAVGICRATGTSRVLLRILLEDFHGVQPRWIEDASAEQLLSGELAAGLLIGDEALAFRSRARAAGSQWSEHDLGDMWWRATSLPMVFAVWAVRRATPFGALAESLGEALRGCRGANASLPPAMLARARDQTGMSLDELRAYYGGLSFGLDEEARHGLLKFYQRAAAHGLCPPCERLSFWSGPAVPQPLGTDRPTVAGKGDAHG